MEALSVREQSADQIDIDAVPSEEKEPDLLTGSAQLSTNYSEVFIRIRSKIIGHINDRNIASFGGYRASGVPRLGFGDQITFLLRSIKAHGPIVPQSFFKIPVVRQ